MTQKIDSRPKSLSIMMLVPVFFALGLAVVYGWVMYMMSHGRLAEGKKVSIEFSGTCLLEAKPIISKRMNAMGLGEPNLSIADGKLTAIVQLPGFREQEEEHIPKMLRQRGVWQMRYQEEVLLSNDDIRSVTYGEDESGNLEVLLAFHEKKRVSVQELLEKEPDKQTEIWLDDRMVIYRPNRVLMSDDFRFVSDESNPAEKSQEAADFLILLSNPVMPCELKLSSVTILQKEK
jgi:preprotein translocase subunit SecD